MQEKKKKRRKGPKRIAMSRSDHMKEEVQVYEQGLKDSACVYVS